MLLKISDNLFSDDQLAYMYKGFVVSNTDGKNHRRIKVKIERLLEGDDSNLPWCYPVNPDSGSPDSSSPDIPEVGTQVAVVFPYNDIYFPVYLGSWVNASTYQTLWDEDYPNSFGHMTSEISWLRTNKTQKYVEMFHVSGMLIRVDTEGNIDIRSPKDLSIKADGKIDIKATNDLTVKAKNINLKADTNIGLVAGGNIGEICVSHGIKASGTQGIEASAISHQASKIDHNSGIVFGTASTVKAAVNAAVGTLDTAMADIDTKIAELIALRDGIVTLRNNVKADVIARAAALKGDR